MNANKALPSGPSFWVRYKLGDLLKFTHLWKIIGFGAFVASIRYLILFISYLFLTYFFLLVFLFIFRFGLVTTIFRQLLVDGAELDMEGVSNVFDD